MFTIIICSYNGARTIHDAIRSVLQQDEYDSLVEQFIVVDNASIDSTKDIVNGFSDERITYAYQPLAGLGNARLKGVELATADWIVFVDDDNELDPNWIKTAAEFIESHPSVGIFGGSVVPKLEFEATAEEYEHLKRHRGMLACTDLSRDQIDFSRTRSPLYCTVGAGMVVKTVYLKELADRGWIKQMGRTKDNLASGDDTEIGVYIIQRRKQEEGHCPRMILEHNLSRNRLQSDYLLKLHRPLITASYNYQTRRKWYWLRRMKRIVYYLTKKNPYKDGTLEYQMWKQEKKLYLSYCLKDVLFLKKVK